MIARVWTAQSSPTQAPLYVEHLRNRVLPALRIVDGYGGSMLLERDVLGGVEIMVITFWRSVDSIRGFAGDDLEGAVVAEQAAALLTQFDRRVRHYDVAVNDGV